MDKYTTKIQHYQTIQIPPVVVGTVANKADKDNSPTIPPRSLREFGGLSIFGKPCDLPKADRSLGPFCCDPSISLTRGEISILSKDPNFSIGFEPNHKQFQVEVQRMLSKHRVNENIIESKKKASDHMKLDNSLISDNINTNLRLDRLHDIFQ